MHSDCIRDFDDCFLLPKTTWFSPLCSVDVGEAIGLYQALQWAAELGLIAYIFLLIRRWLSTHSMMMMIIINLVVVLVFINVDNCLQLF